MLTVSGDGRGVRDMEQSLKPVARVVGHIISASLWFGSILKAIITGNWKGVVEKVILGIAGHIVTELLA